MPSRPSHPSRPVSRPTVPPPADGGFSAADLPTDGFSVVTWEPVDLSQALVVVGFPSVGLVGSIATAHLVATNRPREVGAILSTRFPPQSVVHEGVSASPVRVYLGNLVCGLDGVCDQLCLVHSDIVPKPDSIAALVYAIVRWARERNAREIVCLEGLISEDAGSRPPPDPPGAPPAPPPEDAKVYGVASSPEGRQVLETMGVSVFEDGLLAGIGGVALYAARAVGLPALALVAESRPNYPDARGAARLLEALQPLVPLVKIDEKPLLEKAEVFERLYRAQVARSNRAVKDLSDRADIMYG